MGDLPLPTFSLTVWFPRVLFVSLFFHIYLFETFARLPSGHEMYHISVYTCTVTLLILDDGF